MKRITRNFKGLGAALLTVATLAAVVLVGAGSLVAAAAPQAPAPPPAATRGAAPALTPAPASGKRFADPYQAYDSGVYDQALQGFVDRQVERPDDPRLALNLGNTYYKMKDYESAAQSFAAAAANPDPSIKEQALYSLGNVSYRQGKLEDAVKLFQAALEVDPNDEDAKYNLELVRDEIRRRQEEAQKRQQQDPKQQQQDQQQQGQQEQQKEQQQQQQEQGQQGQQPDEKQQPPQPAPGEEGQEQAEPSQAEAGQAEGGQPGEMNRETAERLLAALEEGRPTDKRPARAARSVRAGKDW